MIGLKILVALWYAMVNIDAATAFDKAGVVDAGRAGFFAKRIEHVLELAKEPLAVDCSRLIGLGVEYQIKRASAARNFPI